MEFGILRSESDDEPIVEEVLSVFRILGAIVEILDQWVSLVLVSF
jgi:hypothetical protein